MRGIRCKIRSLKVMRDLKKNHRANIPKDSVNKKRQIKVRSLLPYTATCSEERKRNPLLNRLKSCNRLETTPINGFVKKLTVKTTIAIVTTRGRRITRPVIKYFFMQTCLRYTNRLLLKIGLIFLQPYVIAKFSAR